MNAEGMASVSGPSTRKARRRVTRYVIPLVLLAGLGVGGWFAYDHYTDAEYVRRTAQAYLQRYTHGDVRVGRAQFSWADGIRLHDVVISAPGWRDDRAGTEDRAREIPAFSCREVELTTDRLAALFGRLRIETLVAVEPRCSIIRDVETGRTNLANLLRSIAASDDDQWVSLPTVELRNATVCVIDRHPDADRLVDDITLTIRGRSARRQPRVYDVVWHREGTGPADGHAQLDLQTGYVRNIRGGLPSMSIEAVMLAVNARYSGAGTWSDLLGLRGKVRVRDYDLRGDLDTGGLRSATIELRNAALSIPVTASEQPLSADQRYLRFDNVYGRVTLTADHVRADFEGVFHGSRCQVAADMYGRVEELRTLDDVDFTARLALSDLTLPSKGPAASPQERRFIRRWHPVAAFYKIFDPHGLVDIELDVAKKAGADNPIVARHGLMTVKDGDASCHFFPYRVEHVDGVVEISPEGILLRDLRGEHDGGVVDVDGWLAGPTRCTPADLYITGTKVPIDDALARALKPKYRRIRELFRPHGRLDIELQLTRGDSPDGDRPAKWESAVAVSFLDLTAEYVGFPVPVEHLSGMLSIMGKRLQVVDVRGLLGRARVNLSGDLTFGKAGPDDMNLTIDASDVRLTDTLLAALPGALEGRVRRFRPAGTFDMSMSVALDPNAAGITYDATVTLTGMTVRHERFPVTIADIRGPMHLTRDMLEVTDVTGRYGDGIARIHGRMQRNGSQRGVDLSIECRHLLIDEPLRAAAPPSLRRVLSDWRVDGPIAADVDLVVDPVDGPGDLELTTVAHIDGANVKHPRFPIPFENVRAEIHFDNKGARAQGIVAQYGDAAVRVDFETRRSAAGEYGTIRLDATDVPLDASLRDILPGGVKAAWGRLGLIGRVDLRLDPLRYETRSPGEPRVWSAAGTVQLHDVAIPGVADIKHMSGRVIGDGLLLDPVGGTVLNGDLELTRVDVFGRRVTSVQSPWVYAHTADGGGQLNLAAVQGEVYGGRMAATADVMLDPEGTNYELTTKLQGVELGPFVNAGRDDGEEPVDAEGRTNAQFNLSGEVGARFSKRGSGRVEIDEGRMYRLPIILAILNVFNLSAPDDRAFDNAEADFRIAGNQVQFSNILLRGSALELQGAGTMSLPDRGLDLSLHSKSQWGRVPGVTDFVEGVSKELVELRVKGPLSRPTVRLEMLPNINRERKELFKKKDKKTIQPAPS